MPNEFIVSDRIQKKKKKKNFRICYQITHVGSHLHNFLFGTYLFLVLHLLCLEVWSITFFYMIICRVDQDFYLVVNYLI